MNFVFLGRLFVVLCIVGGATGAQAIEFKQVLADKSAISFGYKQMGVAMDGRFRKFDAKLVFDPAKSASASAQIDIDLASIDTGSADGDAEVAGKQWFNTKTFPSARFISSSVKPLGGSRFEVTGKLSIKGRTLDAIAPLTFRQEGSQGVFDGQFTLKRLDYAIGEGAWADVATVANEVLIKFHVVADSAIKK